MTSNPTSSKTDNPHPVTGQSYFLAWAIRSAEESEQDDVSPLTKTPPPSNSISTIQPNEKRASRNQLLLRESTEPAHVPSPVDLVSFHNDTSRRRRRASSGSIVSRRSDSTGRSSIKSRARTASEFSNRRHSLTPPEDVQPPRKAMTGYTWQQDLSGYWQEVRIAPKAHSTTKLKRLHSENASMIPDNMSLQPRHIVLETSDITRYDAPSMRSMKDGLEHMAMHRMEAKLGLYCRMRRRLGLSVKGTPKSGRDYGELGPRSRTGEMLEYASNLLREMVDKRTSPPSPLGGASIASIAGGHGHRSGLVAHSWRSSNHSTSSSIWDIMRGKPPASSPEPEALYTGSDEHQYFRVDMTHPESPSILPSEARRVTTPPGPSSAPNGRLRGFFFDYEPPDDEHPLSADSKAIKISSDASLPPGPEVEVEVEWFRVKVSSVSADTFELNVPEHLPNSPLCPKNPKHPSGGNGICVYHGRNRTISTSLDGIGTSAARPTLP
ncbi:hypothetical protein MMC06_005723 [Schaereria dolodes]|nr:hypothetical protein [Schaereria dolodes]